MKRLKKEMDMKHNQLFFMISALFVMSAPQIVWCGEAAAESVGEDLEGAMAKEMLSGEEIAGKEAGVAERLQNDLKEAFGKEGAEAEQAFKDIATQLGKDPEEFAAQAKSFQEAAKEAKAAGADAEKAFKDSMKDKLAEIRGATDKVAADSLKPVDGVVEKTPADLAAKQAAVGQHEESFFKKMIVDQLIMSVMMMIPNVLQSAYLAQMQKAAALKQWAAPIRFGNGVYQIPDSCINPGNPAASYPVYIRLPVASASEVINLTLANLYNNAISGPSKSNAISACLRTASANFFAFGQTGSLKRYDIDESQLNMFDMAIVYGAPGGYVQTGAVAINSSQSSGQIMSLATGLVSDASGKVVNATGLSQYRSVPLLPLDTSANNGWGTLTVPQTAPAAQAFPSVYSVLPQILSKQQIGGSRQAYTEYQGDTSGRASSDSVQSALSTGCITTTGSLRRPDCKCVLISGVEQLKAGLQFGALGNPMIGLSQPSHNLAVRRQQSDMISAVGGESVNSQGVMRINPQNVIAAKPSHKVLGRLSMTPAARPSSASAPAPTLSSSYVNNGRADVIAQWTGLGSVIPVFGWGSNDGYKSIIKPFESFDFDPASAAISPTARRLGVAKSADSLAGVKFADANVVWPTQGCWVYLATQTPLVQELSKAYGMQPSLTGSLVDYIVFLDEQFNVVPMMQPVEYTVNYTGSTLVTKPTFMEKLSNAFTWLTRTDKKSSIVTGEVNARHTFTKIVMGLNPAVKYWTSLVGHNLPGLGAGGSVMYDMQGGVWTLPAGKISAYLNTTQQGTGIDTYFPDISNQIKLHSAALQFLYNKKPISYKNASLKVSKDYKIVMGSSSADLYTGTGLYCLGSTVSDLFLPLKTYPITTSLSVETLPGAQYLVSLVTDVVYKLQPDNSWQPFDFSNSMVQVDSNNQPVMSSDGQYAVNLADKGKFFFMSGLYSAQKVPVKLQAYLIAQKDAWIEQMKSVHELGSGDLAAKIYLAQGISTQYAQKNNAFIYEINPAPSMISLQDFYGIVNAQQPTLQNLVLVNADNISGNSNLVSLVTGMVYDTDSNLVTDDQGNQVRIAVGSIADGMTSSQMLYNAMVKKFANLPTQFVTAYKKSVDAYAAQQMQPMGPYKFGDLSIAIRSADLNNQNYIYFNAGSMHSATIKPSNLFIVVDADSVQKSMFTPVVYDAKKEQFLVDIISGQVFDQNGMMRAQIPAASMAGYVSQWTNGANPWVMNNLTELKALYTQTKTVQITSHNQTQQRLQQFADDNNKAALINKADALAIIASAQSGPKLPIPFSGLLYDEKTAQFIHPLPASTTDATQKNYYFFGNGCIYRGSDGAYLSCYIPAHAAATLAQYGVVINADGKQTLAIPMLQPALIMQSQDASIVLGKSGASLISSMDANFPGESVAMPRGYDLYYSKIMDTYYIFDEQTARWMSVDGGHIYEKRGEVVIKANKVAVGTKPADNMSAADDLILIQKNDLGHAQGYLSDGSLYAYVNQNSDGTANWMGMNSPYDQLSVFVNKAGTEFAITGRNDYTLESHLKWHQMILVPIDENGVLLTNVPANSYRYAQIVSNSRSNKLQHCLYNRVMYGSVGSKGNTYILKPVDTTSKAGQITVTVGLVDKGTNVQYITIQDGANTYRYCYVPQSFDQTQQATNRATIWRGSTVPVPVHLAVGPMVQQTKTFGKEAVMISVPSATTYVAFVHDIVPSQLKPVAITDVINRPQRSESVTDYMDLQVGVTKVLQTVNNRYVCAVGPNTEFTSEKTDAYVDLTTGALYDKASGTATGYAMAMDDFTDVLNTCHVCVAKNPKTGKQSLMYRASVPPLAPEVSQPEETAPAIKA